MIDRNVIEDFAVFAESKTPTETHRYTDYENCAVAQFRHSRRENYDPVLLHKDDITTGQVLERLAIRNRSWGEIAAAAREYLG